MTFGASGPILGPVSREQPADIMEFVSRRKNEFGKSDTPGNTIGRLEAKIGALWEYEYVEERLAEHLYWSLLLIPELGWRSMGKGISPELCRASALAEAAEAAGWLTGSEVKRLPGYVNAHQDELDDPLRIDDLLSHVATATPPVLEKIKNLECARHWIDAYSLMENRTRKVPIEYVRLISWGNGHAAGNTLEEAVDHAVNEVFERRAQVTILRDRMVAPTIDIESIDSPVVRSQIEFFRSKGIEAHVKDLSFEGQLPCIGVYFLDHNIPEDFQFKHFFKVGSSFDREDALIRCFTEFAQHRKLDDFIQGGEAERKRLLERAFRNLKCIAADGDNLLSSFLFGLVPYADADFLLEGDVVAFDRGDCFDDFLDDIGRAREICALLGKDFLVVDFTDPGIGFPAVQVIIPGYGDVLPYHPGSSDALFRTVPREELLDTYERGPGGGATYFSASSPDGG